MPVKRARSKDGEAPFGSMSSATVEHHERSDRLRRKQRHDADVDADTTSATLTQGHAEPLDVQRCHRGSTQLLCVPPVGISVVQVQQSDRLAGLADGTRRELPPERRLTDSGPGASVRDTNERQGNSCAVGDKTRSSPRQPTRMQQKDSLHSAPVTQQITKPVRPGRKGLCDDDDDSGDDVRPHLNSASTRNHRIDERRTIVEPISDVNRLFATAIHTPQPGSEHSAGIRSASETECIERGSLEGSPKQHDQKALTHARQEISSAHPSRMGFQRKGKISKSVTNQSRCQPVRVPRQSAVEHQSTKPVQPHCSENLHPSDASSNVQQESVLARQSETQCHDQRFDQIGNFEVENVAHLPHQSTTITTTTTTSENCETAAAPDLMLHPKSNHLQALPTENAIDISLGDEMLRKCQNNVQPQPEGGNSPLTSQLEELQLATHVQDRCCTAESTSDQAELVAHVDVGQCLSDLSFHDLAECCSYPITHAGHTIHIRVENENIEKSKHQVPSREVQAQEPESSIQNILASEACTGAGRIAEPNGNISSQVSEEVRATEPELAEAKMLNEWLSSKEVNLAKLWEPLQLLNVRSVEELLQLEPATIAELRVPLKPLEQKRFDRIVLKLRNALKEAQMSVTQTNVNAQHSDSSAPLQPSQGFHQSERLEIPDKRPKLVANAMDKREGGDLAADEGVLIATEQCASLKDLEDQIEVRNMAMVELNEVLVSLGPYDQAVKERLERSRVQHFNNLKRLRVRVREAKARGEVRSPTAGKAREHKDPKYVHFPGNSKIEEYRYIWEDGTIHEYREPVIEEYEQNCHSPARAFEIGYDGLQHCHKQLVNGSGNNQQSVFRGVVHHQEPMYPLHSQTYTVSGYEHLNQPRRSAQGRRNGRGGNFRHQGHPGDLMHLHEAGGAPSYYCNNQRAPRLI